MMAEIAVIVPVYKVEEYLDRCVRSVLDQSYPELTLILVDDGSPDRCPALCDEYAGKDPRVHVIHKKNGGLSDARNAGIDYALAETGCRWITFLDSDDWLHRDCLRRLLVGTEEEGVGVSACNFCRVRETWEDEVLEEPRPVILKPESAYVQYYGELMTACCKLIRRDLLESVRFPVGKLHEDAFVTHLLTFGSQKVAVLEEQLYYYYYNPASITRKEWAPKRLEELEGHQVRLDYLQEHGYQRAWRRELELTAVTTYEHTVAIALTGREGYEEIFRTLRQQLRRTLQQCRKYDLCPLNRENMWMYLMAYPGKPVWLFLQKLQGIYHDRMHR